MKSVHLRSPLWMEVEENLGIRRERKKGKRKDGEKIPRRSLWLKLGVRLWINVVGDCRVAGKARHSRGISAE